MGAPDRPAAAAVLPDECVNALHDGAGFATVGIMQAIQSANQAVNHGECAMPATHAPRGPVEICIHPAAQRRPVIIDGPSSVQNKALAELIQARTGYYCAVYAADRLNGWAWKQPLVLLDAARCVARLPALCANRSFSIVLINADEGFPCEYIACPGVKGLFFADTSEEDLIRGIKAIFEGEYWLPRSLLCAHLERTRSIPLAQGPGAMRLTPKEMQTLRLLAKGDSNRHIARELNVSPHTVKVHTSNLFRKIQVNNRVQAAQWASRHMLTACE